MNDVLLYGIAITVLVISDVLLVALGVYVYRSRQQPDDTPRSSAEEDQTRHDELRQDIRNLSLALNMISERLSRQEHQLERVQDRLQEREPAQGSSAPVSKEGDRRAFEVATKMALKGADVEELINVCGLTRGEAELIRMLHTGEEGRQKFG